MWHPGAARGGGANEAYLSRCFAAPPNFNVVDSGVGSLKLKKSSLKLGEWGGVSGQEVIWIHSLARTSAFEWRLEKASGSSKVLGD